MSIIPKFYGRIVGGKKQYYRPKQYANWMLLMEGKEFEEVIQQKIVNPSNDQHAYYRAIVRWLSYETEIFGGWDEDYIHSFFANKLLSRKIVTQIYHNDGSMTSEELIIIPSTAKLTRKEMSEFIQKFLDWLAGEGIFPPEADEFVTKNYATKTKYEKSEPNPKG